MLVAGKQKVGFSKKDHLMPHSEGTQSKELGPSCALWGGGQLVAVALVTAAAPALANPALVGTTSKGEINNLLPEARVLPSFVGGTPASLSLLKG